MVLVYSYLVLGFWRKEPFDWTGGRKKSRVGGKVIPEITYEREVPRREDVLPWKCFVCLLFFWFLFFVCFLPLWVHK